MANGAGYMCAGLASVAGMAGTISLYLNSGGTEGKSVSHQSQNMSLGFNTAELTGVSDGVISGLIATQITRTYRAVFTPTSSYSKAKAIENAITVIKPLAVCTVTLTTDDTMYHGSYNVRSWSKNSDNGPLTIEMELWQYSADGGSTFTNLPVVS